MNGCKLHFMDVTDYFGEPMSYITFRHVILMNPPCEQVTISTAVLLETNTF